MYTFCGVLLGMATLASPTGGRAEAADHGERSVCRTYSNLIASSAPDENQGNLPMNPYGVVLKALKHRVGAVVKVAGQLTLALLLTLGHYLEAAAEIEEHQFTVWMTAQPIFEGFRPYLGKWGPVTTAHLTRIRVPPWPTVDFRVSFVKSGFSTADCGNPDRIVVIRDGEATTSDQIRDIFGVSRVPANQPISFVACAGAVPSQQLDQFFVNITYEKEMEDDRPDDDKPSPLPPPLKEESFEGDLLGKTRIYTVFCQQMHANRGCFTSFSCPDRWALTNIRAACDLETGRKQPLPSWGSVRVGRASDHVDEGICEVGQYGETVWLRSGSRLIEPSTFTAFRTRSAENLGCSEHDKNGGDCSIHAQFQCRQVNPSFKNIVPFTCSRGNSNEGCTKAIKCPLEHIAWSARASCNLETVKTPALPDLGWLKVVRPSDTSGACWINKTRLSWGAERVNVFSAASVNIGCKEHDENGGDCNISGELTCVKFEGSPLDPPLKP
jgi:hypothetical protein